MRQHGTSLVLNGIPAPVHGAPPAYPDGWISIAVETQAECGFDVMDALAHEPTAFEPISHCLRLTWLDRAVRDWLTTYTMITTGMKAAPEWTHPFYSSAMIGIRSVQQGIEYARAMAQRRAIDNARGVHG